ncbi:MAG: DUF1543 domain-containing protein [Chitinophagaceae bacterium]
MQQKLFMVIMGATPEGRQTEQHDVFFGIAASLKDLVPDMRQAWPEAKGRIHIDSWREVTLVDGFSVTVAERNFSPENTMQERVFFLNLGGYKPGDMEEYHYKMLVVASDTGKAVQHGKASTFYKHTGFPGATAHVDDKYGIDVDDVHQVEDILPASMREKYRLELKPATSHHPADELHIGYLKLEKLLKETGI